MREPFQRRGLYETLYEGGSHGRSHAHSHLRGNDSDSGTKVDCCCEGECSLEHPAPPLAVCLTQSTVHIQHAYLQISCWLLDVGLFLVGLCGLLGPPAIDFHPKNSLCGLLVVPLLACPFFSRPCATKLKSSLARNGSRLLIPVSRQNARKRDGRPSYNIRWLSHSEFMII